MDIRLVIIGTGVLFLLLITIISAIVFYKNLIKRPPKKKIALVAFLTAVGGVYNLVTLLQEIFNVI